MQTRLFVCLFERKYQLSSTIEIEKKFGLESAFQTGGKEGKAMGNLYGYIRVSTREQNEDRQILALRELSIPEKN